MSKTIVDMTEGDAQSHLIRYSIPLILGNLFQLAYNVVDSVIVGQCIGKEALAAEGIAAPVMNIIILGISGVCIGAGVLMSEFFGARQYGELRKALVSFLLPGLFFAAAVVALGALMTPALLTVLQVPGEIRGLTGTYLRIIFLGAPFTYLYNALAAALKSVGDSRTPLRFLMLASILNAVSDIVLIGFLGFGIVCSALTTVFAEAASALLTLLYMQKKIPLLRLRASEWRIDRFYLRRILQMGGVTALQQSVQPVCKLLMQGCVNTLGVDGIAAYNAVTRMDDFACIPAQSISSGITTFLAQNRGAGKTDRMLRGFGSGMRLEGGYAVCICLVTLLCRRGFVSMFVAGESSAEIVAIGADYLFYMAFFYFFPAFTNGLQGYFRGVQRMEVTLLCTTLQAGTRCLMTYLLTPRLGIRGIAFACAIGWSLMLLYEAPCCLADRKRRMREAEPS